MKNNDIQQYFIEKGQGEALILLHGNGENCGYFQGQMDAFSKRYHVYAIDTRGHGRTPRGSRPFTIRQFAEDLRYFMDRQRIEKAHLLGFSDGGNIAMVFAIQYPDRVGYRIAGAFAGKKESARRKAELLGLMVNDPNLDPADLAGIRAKTLVIAGTRDMIKEEHTKLIADSIPEAELVFLKGDHFVAARHPDAFNRAVLKFLGS